MVQEGFKGCAWQGLDGFVLPFFQEDQLGLDIFYGLELWVFFPESSSEKVLFYTGDCLSQLLVCEGSQIQTLDCRFKVVGRVF